MRHLIKRLFLVAALASLPTGTTFAALRPAAPAVAGQEIFIKLL